MFSRKYFLQVSLLLSRSIVRRNYATQNRTSIIKPIGLGLGIGVVAGSSYSFYSKSKRGIPGTVVEQKNKPITFDTLPANIKIARTVHSNNGETDVNLVLFQFQTCPFCCKVRAYLDYKGISYSVVEVDAVLRQDLKWSAQKKVPIVLMKLKNGKFVQLSDSSLIISVLETHFKHPEKDILDVISLYPTISFYDNEGQPKSDILNKYYLVHEESNKKAELGRQTDEKQWRSWADEHLVHLISPNVYRSKEEALSTFHWFAEAGEWKQLFPEWEQKMMIYFGALAMYLISKRLKDRYELGDDVRKHLYSACNDWTAGLKKHGTKFMGGQEPNLADLAVFGILSSMEGCAAFTDCLENTAIGNWFYEVKKAVLRNRIANV